LGSTGEVSLKLDSRRLHTANETNYSEMQRTKQAGVSPNVYIDTGEHLKHQPSESAVLIQEHNLAHQPSQKQISSKMGH